MYSPAPQNQVDPAEASGMRSVPLSAPAYMTTFGTGSRSQLEPHYSSPDELKDLWEAANGQEVGDNGRTFALKMSRFVSP
jgi:hypothetical protein